MQLARSHVHLTGWYFTPGFALVRDGDPVVLRDLLAEVAERVAVRVLAWAGAPLPLFRPSRSDVRKVRDQLTANTKIQVALDSHERPLHCHHEKTIVIDDRVAFVGGIDLTTESGDRYDANHHPPRATVELVSTPAPDQRPSRSLPPPNISTCAGIEVTGEQLADVTPSASAGEIEVQIVRTVPERIYRATRNGDFGILESYVRALRGAQRLIYLESKRSRSPEIAAVLAEKIARLPSPDFRLLMLLPAKPNSGTDDTRGVPRRADRSRRRRRPDPRRTIYPRHERPRRPDLRPRQGRDHRRRLV